MQDSVAVFARPVAPSTKRPSIKIKRTTTIKNMQQSQSTNDIVAARHNKLHSASLTELPTYEALSQQGKENGHPNTSYLHKSVEIGKPDRINLDQATIQAQMEHYGVRNDIPCTPRFVPHPEALPKPLLPTVDDSKNPDLRLVDSDTMAKLITGANFAQLYQKIVIIDCRFDYEFDGGHIRSAVNINATDDLAELLFQPDMLNYGDRLCVILHCEFSSQRGPKMYRHLRKLDRLMNKNNYPNLSFPEIYVLKGGYREFFQTYRHLCDPDCYVEMTDPGYAPQLKEAMRKGSSNARKHRSRSCSELDFTARVRAMQSHSRLISSDTVVGHPLAASTMIPASQVDVNMHIDDDDAMQVDTPSPPRGIPQSFSASAIDFSQRSRHAAPRSPGNAKRSLVGSFSAFEGVKRAHADASDYTPRQPLFAPPAPDFGFAAAQPSF